MKSPYIGRGIALALIVGLVAWTAVRALGARSPESPKMPFPVPALDAPLAGVTGHQTAVFAGGCFLGCSGGIRTSQGCDFCHFRLRGRLREIAFLRNRQHGSHRPRRIGECYLRPFPNHVWTALDGFLLRGA